MDNQHFTVVAGFPAAAHHDATLADAAAQPGFDLVAWQVRGDPSVAAEIVETIYGYGLRYASGLQGFSIIARAESVGGTLDKALEYAQKWAAQDDFRYVFIRNSALAKAGEIAVKVAERDAAIAKARRISDALKANPGKSWSEVERSLA